jgi:hypothetical protein
VLLFLFLLEQVTLKEILDKIQYLEHLQLKVVGVEAIGVIMMVFLVVQVEVQQLVVVLLLMWVQVLNLLNQVNLVLTDLETQVE